MKRILSLIGFLLVASSALAQDLRYPFTQPLSPFDILNGAPAATTIDASGKGTGGIFIAKEAATITKLCYVYGLRTGTPPTYKIGMETVNGSTGDPSGTYKTGTGECSFSFTPPANTSIDGTKVCQTLTGTTCAVTRGEQFAITIRYASGTIGVGNNSSFNDSWSTGFNDTYGSAPNNEYQDILTAGPTWTKGSYSPMFTYENSTRVFGNIILSLDQNFYDSGSTPNEYAMRFQYPCPSGQKFQLSAIVPAFPQTCSAGKTLTAKLYDGTTNPTTAIQSGTIDCDNTKSVNANRHQAIWFTDSTLQDLNCSATYRVSLVPNEASSGLGIGVGVVSANADFDAWPWGVQTYLSTRAGGSWTDVTTKRPIWGLVINKLNTVSGGTSTISNGFNKGIN